MPAGKKAVARGFSQVPGEDFDENLRTLRVFPDRHGGRGAEMPQDSTGLFRLRVPQ